MLMVDWIPFRLKLRMVQSVSWWAEVHEQDVEWLGVDLWEPCSRLGRGLRVFVDAVDGKER